VFHPLWAGIATQEQAALTRDLALPRLELEFGICTCEPGTRTKICQWDHPNAWPCLQLITYRGLARYGALEDARRIAGKYVATVCRGFSETGDLWEKYNAQDGSSRSKGEAGCTAPAMMGWTAGVFLDAAAFLRETGATPSSRDLSS
jgi:alpha,alpha-trehalase